jgi:heptaprenyl diphosphate synthase
MSKSKRLVLLALMVAQAMILSIVETWIPVPTVIPGVKLGLANIISLMVIVLFGLRDALAVVTVRCILTSMLAGGISLLPFSLTGGVLSTLAMYFLYKRFPKTFSMVGISVGGSTMHNIGQLLAASVLMRDPSVFGYLPVLMASGIVMGCFVGFCTHFLSAALKRTGLFEG